MRPRGDENDVGDGKRLTFTALRDFTSYEAKPIGLASQKSSDSRPADIAYSRSLKVVADMEREVERRRIGYNRFQRAGHPIASVPIAQLTAEEKERYGLGQAATSVLGPDFYKQWMDDIKDTEAVHGRLEECRSDNVYVPGVTQRDKGSTAVATARTMLRSATSTSVAALDDARGGDASRAPLPSSGSGSLKRRRRAATRSPPPPKRMLQNLRTVSYAKLAPLAPFRTRGQASDNPDTWYEGTSLEFDPALPKELRVADATLRRRRREAIRAGHLNDFNPGVIGTTEASRDPSVIRSTIEPEIPHGVLDIGVSLEMEARFQRFIAAEWEVDGLWQSEFRSQIARPLSPSVYFDSTMRARGVGAGPSLQSYLSTASSLAAEGLTLDAESRKRLVPFSYSLHSHAAATLIQRAWLGRAETLRKVVAMVQAAFRGMKVRRNFKRWRAIALMAIVKMQAVGRGRLARKLYGSMQEKRRNQCAVKIQRVILGVLGRMRAARIRAIRNHRAAKWIQTVARSKIARDRVSEMRFRLWLVEHEKVLCAAVHIQRVARGKMGRIAARITWHRRVHAINIQRVWRGFITRKRLLDLKAVRIQKWYRGIVDRIMVEELKLERAEEAVRRQNLEDEVVDNDGKAAVSAMLDLLTTDEGKSMIKEEKKMVKKWLAKNAKRRKLMSKQQRTLEDLRDTFEMYDVDGSGGIELEELTLMTRELCIPMNETELVELFERLDVSGDGNIDVKEFIAWYFDVGKEEPVVDVVEPKGLLETPAATTVGKRIEKLFKRVNMKFFQRDPLKAERARPEQVAPEDFLVVTEGELKHEVETYKARVVTDKKGRETLPKPLRPMDLTKRGDPRPPKEDDEGVPVPDDVDDEAEVKGGDSVEDAAGEDEDEDDGGVGSGAGAGAGAGSGPGTRAGAGGDDDAGGGGGDEGDADGDGDGEGEGDGDGELEEHDSDYEGLDEDIDEFDENGNVTLRSPTFFFRHDSEDDLLEKKDAPVLPPSQYRKLRGYDNRLQKPDNAAERAKGQRKEKKGAVQLMLRTKLKALKVFRQLLGRHVTAIARRNLVAEARYKARVKSRRRFRRENPPVIECSRCPATFGLYRPYRRHWVFECPRTGNGEYKPRMKRA